MALDRRAPTARSTTAGGGPRHRRPEHGKPARGGQPTRCRARRPSGACRRPARSSCGRARNGSALLFENAALGVVILDSQGYVVAANAVSSGLLGYAPGGLVGKHFLQFAAPEEHERASGPLRRATARRAGFLRRRLPLPAPHGRGRLGPPVDVRHPRRKRPDAARHRSRSGDRRAETGRRATAPARRGEKLRALGEMASGVAHDLNQYLGLVAGHGELALHELDGPRIDRDSLRDSLRTVVQAAMDGANTVKRLQTFARPRQEGPPRRVDAGELLREVAKLTAPRWRDAAQAQGQPIHVEVETEGQPLVEGGPSSLREALTNLVFNAVDALPHGGTIRLAARQTGERVELAVADSGLGMSAETQARRSSSLLHDQGRARHGPRAEHRLRHRRAARRPDRRRVRARRRDHLPPLLPAPRRRPCRALAGRSRGRLHGPADPGGGRRARARAPPGAILEHGRTRRDRRHVRGGSPGAFGPRAVRPGPVRRGHGRRDERLGAGPARPGGATRRSCSSWRRAGARRSSPKRRGARVSMR